MLFDYLKRGVAAGVIAGLSYGLYIALVANPLLDYIHHAGHDPGHSHDDDGHGHDDGHSHDDDHGHDDGHSHDDDHGHDDGHSHDEASFDAVDGGHASGDGAAASPSGVATDGGFLLHGDGHDHSHAVSETTNAIVSVGSGVLWGILLAGVFAIAFYFLEPALPGRGGVKAAVLAAAGFFAVSITPWLVLPPAAPGALETLPIDTRLAIYAGLIVLGAVVAAISIAGYNRTVSRGRLTAIGVAAVPVLLTVAVLWTVPPTIISHPEHSSDLVLAFQGSALLSQAALWAIIAGAFSWLHRRADDAPVTRRTDADDDLLATP